MKRIMVTFKFPKPIVARLKAAAKGPIPYTMTAIVLRGLEMVLQELERKK